MVTATRTKRPKMTAEQARTFERYSIANAARAATVLQDSGACHANCEPYSQIFSYARWQALGYQVKKGEHGAKLPVIIQTESENEDGQTVSQQRPWSTTVFCRCQVAPKEKALSSRSLAASC